MLYPIVKRACDLFFSLFLLVLISPFFLLILILLFIINRGKPFFIQMRPGLNEKPFMVIKFKTMTDAKDDNGLLLPDKNRITRIGKFIRKSSLDELPQLINILKGDMSFIGPRPLLIEYLPFYREEERIRHKVRPGMTGLSQVNGRNNILWEDRMKLDIDYVQNMSFKMDLKIIYKTITKLINRENIVVTPSELGRAPLHIRRNPKYKGLYDENGYLKK